jgi:hypothetical protein
MPLPRIVDYDTLALAPALVVRAGAVRPIVDELLAVANDPDRMQGVDPTLIRVRAADLLSAEHDPALLDEAVSILRDAMAMAVPGEIGIARDALAKTLAEQGDVAELDALAEALLREPPTLPWAETLLAMSAISTIFGYGQQAAGWLDKALAAVADGTGRAYRGAAAGGALRSDRATRQVLEDAKGRLARIRTVMAADGCEPDDAEAAHARMQTRPTAAASVPAYPPWPAGFEGRLLWWPEPDYARLTRQVPEVATLLGGPWRGHTALVEAVRPYSLVAAEFSPFAQFLEWSRADPLSPATMTAFTALGQNLPAPARWPPRHRAPCWCGSGSQYRACCERPAACR